MESVCTRRHYYWIKFIQLGCLIHHSDWPRWQDTGTSSELGRGLRSILLSGWSPRIFSEVHPQGGSGKSPNWKGTLSSKPPFCGFVISSLTDRFLDGNPLIFEKNHLRSDHSNPWNFAGELGDHSTNYMGFIISHYKDPVMNQSAYTPSN